MRAVEEGLPLVRDGNNGISAVFDPYGRVLERLDLDAVGVLDAALPQALPPTLYGRIGDARLRRHARGAPGVSRAHGRLATPHADTNALTHTDIGAPSRHGGTYEACTHSSQLESALSFRVNSHTIACNIFAAQAT